MEVATTSRFVKGRLNPKRSTKGGTAMASTNVVIVNDANWEKEVLQSDKPVLVDFWATWCGPCRALAPTIDRLADKYAGQVKVAKLDTDSAPETATRYRISGIPIVMLFNGGTEPVDSVVGLNREDVYDKLLTRV